MFMIKHGELAISIFYVSGVIFLFWFYNFACLYTIFNCGCLNLNYNIAADNILCLLQHFIP